MATVVQRPASRRHRRERPAQGGRRVHHRPGPLRRRPRAARHAPRRLRPLAVRPRHDLRHRHLRCRGDARRRQDHHGRDARPRGRRPVRLEPDRHDAPAAPSAAGRGPRPLPRRAGRDGDRRPTATPPATPPTRCWSTTTRSPPSPTPARRSRRTRRACTTSTTTTAAARWRTRPRASPRRSPPAPRIVKSQQLQPAHHADLDGDARLRRRLGHVDRRGDALHVHAGAAFRANVRGRHQRDVRVEGARGRARRRRRVRLEAELLPRGVPPLRRLEGRRRAGEVDRGSQREHPRHHPRPRPVAVVRGRRRRRRQDPRAEVPRRAEQRRLPAAADAVDLAPDAVRGAGPVRDPARVDHDRPGVHAHHADRRLPRRRPARRPRTASSG